MSLHPVNDAVFILTVKVTIATSSAADFLKHFNQIYPLVAAEPECVYFIFGKQLEVPGLGGLPADSEAASAGGEQTTGEKEDVTVFQWSEGWSKDLNWFMSEQFTKPYYAPYLAATEPMFVKPRQAEIYIPEPGLSAFKK